MFKSPGAFVSSEPFSFRSADPTDPDDLGAPPELSPFSSATFSMSCLLGTAGPSGLSRIIGLGPCDNKK